MNNKRTVQLRSALTVPGSFLMLQIFNPSIGIYINAVIAISIATMIYVICMHIIRKAIIEAAALVSTIDIARRCDVECPCDRRELIVDIPFQKEACVFECDHCKKDIVCRFECNLAHKG